jgi:hypothetical protein
MMMTERRVPAARPPRRGRALGIAESALGGGADGSDFYGPVGALEGGDGIVVGIGAREFMGRAAIEVEL